MSSHNDYLRLPDNSSFNPCFDNSSMQNSHLVLDEWNQAEIDRFNQALDKFNHDWIRIAEYVHRSEQCCQVFYQKYHKKYGLINCGSVEYFYVKIENIQFQNENNFHVNRNTLKFFLYIFCRIENFLIINCIFIQNYRLIVIN